MRDLIFVGSRQKMDMLLVCADVLGYRIRGILDHHYYGHQKEISGVPMIGDERWLLDADNQQARQWLSECVFFPANMWYGVQPRPGELDLQRLRQQRIDILEHVGAEVCNLIFPGVHGQSLASRYSSSRLGRGIYIGEMAHVCSQGCSIGDYSVIYPTAQVNCGAKIGRNTVVAPRVYLHSCTIGDDCYIGLGSEMRWHTPTDPDHEISVGNNCTIWVDTRVNKDVPDNCIMTTHGRILKKKGYP